MSTQISYAIFERVFATPFLYGGQLLSARRGVLLRRGGHVSEASPLPGHSKDTVEEVIAALASGNLSSPPASLAFALEGLDALAAPGGRAVRSNALLPQLEPALAKEALTKFKKEGYRVCKVKVPTEGWDPLFDVLASETGLRYRLDANQSLDPRKLDQVISALSKRALLPRVEYLEEPFAGIWNAKSFREPPLSFAADESAPTPEAAAALLGAENPPSIFIVKPSVAGGLQSLEARLAPIRAAARKIVFTSALETEPARRALVAFLSRAPRGECGISTGSLYRENYLADRAVWDSIPPPGEDELRFHDSLSWKECP